MMGDRSTFAIFYSRIEADGVMHWSEGVSEKAIRQLDSRATKRNNMLVCLGHAERYNWDGFRMARGTRLVHTFIHETIQPVKRDAAGRVIIPHKLMQHYTEYEGSPLPQWVIEKMRRLDLIKERQRNG